MKTNSTSADPLSTTNNGSCQVDLVSLDSVFCVNKPTPQLPVEPPKDLVNSPGMFSLGVFTLTQI